MTISPTAYSDHDLEMDVAKVIAAESLHHKASCSAGEEVRIALRTACHLADALSMILARLEPRASIEAPFGQEAELE